MWGPESRSFRGLVAYYGFFEAAHAAALIWAGIRLLLTGEIGFPALPPDCGWEGQVRSFLLVMGVLDGLNVPLAWLFVYAYLRRARWRWTLGGVTLIAMAYSAMAFAGGTIPSGAWADRPLPYLAIAAAFVPVGLLMVLYAIWATRVNACKAPD